MLYTGITGFFKHTSCHHFDQCSQIPRKILNIVEFKHVHSPVKQRFPGVRPCTPSPERSSLSKSSSSPGSDLLGWTHVLGTGAPYSHFPPPAGRFVIFGLSHRRLADGINVARPSVVAQGHKTLMLCGRP